MRPTFRPRPGVPMLTCPLCKKAVDSARRECPTCRTDLSLLVDFSDHLQQGLRDAEAQTRAGELGEAVWAYLGVLEVDPDNREARRQVGQVAAAVRQFDRIALGRRWLDRMQRRARFRSWMESWDRPQGVPWWVALAAVVALAAGAYYLGWEQGRTAAEPPLLRSGGEAR